jgi:hypothetical protein
MYCVYNISEKKISQSLLQVAPEAYERRKRDTHNKTNPIPYVAMYYGHKLHIDQNEKLVQFGVVHIVARDGYSGKIVAFSTMPVKNNALIYESIYRGVCLTYGIWDQLWVDHGKEFYLTLYVHNQLRKFYGNSQVLPSVQSPSTETMECLITCNRIHVLQQYLPHLYHQQRMPLACTFKMVGD